MMATGALISRNVDAVHFLTKDWGSRDAVTLYLDRCQVDTPPVVVKAVWEQVRARRAKLGRVVDFGAGDGRFATGGSYRGYIGYEIDASRCPASTLPKNATIVNRCAFSEIVTNADLCIGNPPYVRNQDLPNGWRQRAAEVLTRRTGVSLSGLANAWQYFFLLSLASTKPDGLIALVIPYEWVSRPAASAIRQYIKKQRWEVSVYRLLDDTFHRVLTTSSITIIDKSAKSDTWNYFEQSDHSCYKKLRYATGGRRGVLSYAPHTKSVHRKVFAKRGLSPGTQEVFTLTEGERVRLGLKIGSDVVPCITTLRTLNPANKAPTLSRDVFDSHFRNIGLKCWLIKPQKRLSERLEAYLNHVPKEKYQTSTCLERDQWWQFLMPDIPELLVATGFRNESPKVFINTVGARAVGGVCGIYGLPKTKKMFVTKQLRALRLSDRIVAHSNGLRKMEINQLNSLLDKILGVTK